MQSAETCGEAYRGNLPRGLPGHIAGLKQGKGEIGRKEEKREGSPLGVGAETTSAVVCL